MIGRLVSSTFTVLPRILPTPQVSSFNVIPNPSNFWNLTWIRTKIYIGIPSVKRYNFPHPSEAKRVKRYGWFARMATPSGRKIIMRRILKGKHVLTH